MNIIINIICLQNFSKAERLLIRHLQQSRELRLRNAKFTFSEQISKKKIQALSFYKLLSGATQLKFLQFWFHYQRAISSALGLYYRFILLYFFSSSKSESVYLIQLHNFIFPLCFCFHGLQARRGLWIIGQRIAII